VASLKASHGVSPYSNSNTQFALLPTACLRWKPIKGNFCCLQNPHEYNDGMGDLTSDTQKMHRMYSGVAEEIRKHLQLLPRQLDAMEEMRQTIQQIVRPAADALNAMNKAMEPFREQQRQLQGQIDAMAREISHQMQELPSRNREALCLLAQHGWYFDPELPYSVLFEIAAEFKSGNHQSAYSELCDHFEARLDAIEKLLVSMAPDRAKIIESSLAAHKRGEYALSIPVFLAQAEGLCLDFTGFQLYSKKT
jgi:hypothetical protein